MKRAPRQQGAAALGAGLMVWAINIAMMVGPGMFSPTLVIFGGVGIAAGSVLLIWGDSFKTMPVGQKIPAVFIALTLVALAGTVFSRWLATLHQ